MSANLDEFASDINLKYKPEKTIKIDTEKLEKHLRWILSTKDMPFSFDDIWSLIKIKPAVIGCVVVFQSDEAACKMMNGKYNAKKCLCEIHQKNQDIHKILTQFKNFTIVQIEDVTCYDHMDIEYFKDGLLEAIKEIGNKYGARSIYVLQKKYNLHSDADLSLLQRRLNDLFTRLIHSYHHEIAENTYNKWVSNFDAHQTKPRAEYYTREEIESLKMVHRDFHSDPRGKCIMTLGAKGIGKTFSVVKNNCERYGERVAVYQFKKEKKLQTWWPFKNLTNDVEDLDSVLKKADCIIFDDLHYLCESVIEGEIPIKMLLDVLNKIYTASNKVNVRMISECGLAYYADAIDDPRFDELLPCFGEYRQSKYCKKGAAVYRKYLEMRYELIPHEVNQLAATTTSDLQALISSFGAYVEDEVFDTIFSTINGNPRMIVNFLGLFNKRYITEDDVIRIMNKYSKKSVKYYPFFQHPKLKTMVDNYAIAETTAKYKSFQSIVRYINKIEKERLERIRNLKILVKNYSDKYHNIIPTNIKTTITKLLEEKEYDSIMGLFFSLRSRTKSYLPLLSDVDLKKKYKKQVKRLKKTNPSVKIPNFYRYKMNIFTRIVDQLYLSIIITNKQMERAKQIILERAKQIRESAEMLSDVVLVRDDIEYKGARNIIDIYIETGMTVDQINAVWKQLHKIYSEKGNILVLPVYETIIPLIQKDVDTAKELLEFVMHDIKYTKEIIKLER